MRILKFVCFGVCALTLSIATYQSTYTNTAPFILRTPDSLSPLSDNSPILLQNTAQDMQDYSQDFILVPNFEKSAHASSVLDLDSKLMVLFFA